MQVNIDNRAPPSAAPRSTTVAVRITCSQPESCWRVDRAVSPDHFRQLDINRERSIEIYPASGNVCWRRNRQLHHMPPDRLLRDGASSVMPTAYVLGAFLQSLIRSRILAVMSGCTDRGSLPTLSSRTSRSTSPARTSAAA